MIGAGSGGDVYGATLAGCNVVAVENDVAQLLTSNVYSSTVHKWRKTRWTSNTVVPVPA